VEEDLLHLGLRHAVAERGARPVVLLDHYDNCASGGTMDTMTVLGSMLDAGLQEAAAFAIFDPQAVRAMKEAGEGASVTLPLGGKLDMPALGLKGAPRIVSGKVKRIADGKYRNEGPMAKGEAGNLGRAELGPIAAAVVECAGTGVCTSDYSQLRFACVRWPAYPLDPDARAG
jgi:microcystin degradation protein MlrC